MVTFILFILLAGVDAKSSLPVVFGSNKPVVKGLLVIDSYEVVSKTIVVCFAVSERDVVIPSAT